jgi:hypothetical protein
MLLGVKTTPCAADQSEKGLQKWRLAELVILKPIT